MNEPSSGTSTFSHGPVSVPVDVDPERFCKGLKGNSVITKQWGTLSAAVHPCLPVFCLGCSGVHRPKHAWSVREQGTMNRLDEFLNINSFCHMPLFGFFFRPSAEVLVKAVSAKFVTNKNLGVDAHFHKKVNV